MPRNLWRVAIVTALAAVATGGRPTAGEARLQLRLVPAACQDPCNVRVRAIVVPDHENRALTLTAESSTYLRRSIVPLDGASGPRLHVMTFRGLPAGTYAFEARVSRAAADDVVEARTVIVRGS